MGLNGLIQQLFFWILGTVVKNENHSGFLLVVRAEVITLEAKLLLVHSLIQTDTYHYRRSPPIVIMAFYRSFPLSDVSKAAYCLVLLESSHSACGQNKFLCFSCCCKFSIWKVTIGSHSCLFQATNIKTKDFFFFCFQLFTPKSVRVCLLILLISPLTVVKSWWCLRHPNVNVDFRASQCARVWAGLLVCVNVIKWNRDIMSPWSHYPT